MIKGFPHQAVGMKNAKSRFRDDAEGLVIDNRWIWYHIYGKRDAGCELRLERCELWGRGPVTCAPRLGSGVVDCLEGCGMNGGS